MTTLLVRFNDSSRHRDETVKCDSWDTYSDISGNSWFRCKIGVDVIFQAAARDVLFFRVQADA